MRHKPLKYRLIGIVQAFRHALDAYPPDPYLQIAYFHSQTLPDELKRNADSLVPR